MPNKKSYQEGFILKTDKVEKRLNIPIRNNFKEKLLDGELWIFKSFFNLKDRKKNDDLNKYHLGHLGISFDKKQIDDSAKKIYGFKPTSDSWINGCVLGDIKDDTDYFKSFLDNCSSYNDPLYKIDIKFKYRKKKYFFETLGTYSDPFNGDKHFINNFYCKNKYNNCITYIVNNIEPIIQLDDYHIIIRSEFIDNFGLYPGGFISGFIKVYGKYGEKIYRSTQL